MESLNRIQDKIGELSTFAKNNRNVHKEVKQLAADLKAMVHKCRNEYRRMFERRRETEKRCGKKTDGAKIEEGEARSNKTVEQDARSRPTQKRSIAVQTDEDETSRELEKRKSDEDKKLEECLDKGGNFNEIKQWLDSAWPGELYRATKEREFAATDLQSNADLAVITDPEDKNPGGLISKTTRMHPQVDELLQDGPAYGECAYLISKSSITKSSGEVKEGKTKYYMVLALKTDKEGVNDMEEVFSLILKLREVMLQSHRREVQLILHDGINVDYVRKLTEFALRGQGITAELIIKKGNKDDVVRKDPGASTDYKNSKAKRTSNGLVIKAGNRTFAELLREVKESVDINKVAVQIKAIRKTTKGDMYVRVEGDAEKTEKLFVAIRDSGVPAKVEKTRREKTLYIKDIDAVTTEDEIKSIVSKTLGHADNKGEVKLTAVRNNLDGSKTATVITAAEDANKLLALKKIKIGWVNCRIWGRTEVKRCYRCLEPGHEAARCKGVDRSKCCLKCGEVGHKVADCKNGEKCSKCGSKGHRIDSRSCPAYAALVKEIGERSSTRKSTVNN